MKLSFTFLAFLLFASCSNNTTPGTNNNSNTNSQIFGTDYIPLAGNPDWVEHATGSITHLDTNGNLMGTDEVERDYNASLGFVEMINGRSLYPLSMFDNESQQNDGTVGYTGILDSSVYVPYEETKGLFGSNQTEQTATILPKTLTVGQSWMPSPEALPIQCEATLTQHLDSYTNKEGNSYNDVIQVHVSYLDSTSYGTLSYLNKRSAEADLYFAKSVGFIEADVQSWEYLNLVQI